MARAEVLMKSGRWAEAEAAIDAVIAAGGESDATAWFRKAFVQFQTGRYGASAESARKCLAIDGGRAQARKVLGLDLVMLDQTEAAQGELEIAVKALPRDEDANYYLGRVYFTRHNLPAALKQFELLVGMTPGSVRARNQLGQTLEASGRLDDALAAYEHATKLDVGGTKRSQWPWFNLGSLLVRVGRPEEAIAHLQQALVIAPKFREAQVKLATALAQTGKTAEARGLLETVVADEPGNADAHYQLGRLYLKLNMRDRADAHLRRFEALRKN